MKKNAAVSSNLALEFVRVTEFAAIKAAHWIGRGDGKAADKAAVDEMRARFNQIDFRGEVVIGEGTKDEAPELYNGEKLGTGRGSPVDIAVDPLECTDSVAFGRPNAMSVIATGPAGSIYHAVDSYMQKVAVGPRAREVIDIDAPTNDQLHRVAKALGKDVADITVAILDRPRHETLVHEVRAAGARVQLFTDGDVAMAIASCLRESPIDILLGVGGSTEAVLAAAAIKCMGGEILCRWQPKDDSHIKRLHAAGIKDLKKVFSSDDLTKGSDVTFTATGIVTGPLLDGVVFLPHEIITHSVIMTSEPRTLRFLKARHQL